MHVPENCPACGSASSDMQELEHDWVFGCGFMLHACKAVAIEGTQVQRVKRGVLNKAHPEKQNISIGQAQEYTYIYIYR